MEIVFKTKKQAKILNSHTGLVKKYGEKLTRKIELRLSALESSATLADVPVTKPIRCHQLTENRKGQFAVDVSPNERLTFQPNHDPVPQKEDGGIDLSRVTKILIIDIEDYH